MLIIAGISLALLISIISVREVFFPSSEPDQTDDADDQPTAPVVWKGGS